MVGTGVAKPQNRYKASGQGGVPLQYGFNQGQFFAQNGSQKPFCTGLEVSHSVTKTSTGINKYNIYNIYIYIMPWDDSCTSHGRPPQRQDAPPKTLGWAGLNPNIIWLYWMPKGPQAPRGLTLGSLPYLVPSWSGAGLRQAMGVTEAIRKGKRKKQNLKIWGWYH